MTYQSQRELDVYLETERTKKIRLKEAFILPESLQLLSWILL